MASMVRVGRYAEICALVKKSLEQFLTNEGIKKELVDQAADASDGAKGSKESDNQQGVAKSAQQQDKNDNQQQEEEQ